MEYIPGDTLQEKLRGGPLPEAEVLRLAIQLADGLAAAHEHGVIHCDLKPANLKLTPDGRLKILDFGLARLVRPVTTTVTTMSATETATVAGTVPYMAPEQLRCEKVDARTDVLALGAVLYEMGTARRAFGAQVLTALAADIQTKPPTPPRAANPRISGDLEALILKCLEKKPEQRYRAAGEVAADLRRLSEGWKIRGLLRRRVMIGALAGVLLLALGAVGFDVGGVRTRLFGGGSAIRSLAVLPFVNTTGDPETEYLSDGITESIIQDISQIPDLRVIARASVFHYKGREVQPATVASELDVRAVLTGRMGLRGNDLQVSAELVDTRDNRHLWGARYDRRLSDLLLVREEIASRISEGLRLRLSGEDRQRLAKPPSESTEAYRLYLKGRFQLASGWSEEGLGRALDYFRQAIETDPGYALAYVGVGEMYYFLSNVFLAPHEAMPKARAAARQALQLDPDLAEAEALLAMVTALYDWDWEAAERSFMRAIQLKPGNAMAHYWYGYSLIHHARPEEARVELDRAARLDPLSPDKLWYGAVSFAFAPPAARRHDRAVEVAQKTLELDPNFYPARVTIALAYQQTGRVADAVVETQRAYEQSDGGTTWLAILAHAYALAGEPEQARKALQELAEARKTRHVSAYLTSLVHVALREADEAFAWLERSYESREEDLLGAAVDPRLDGLRDAPRLQDLLRRVGLEKPDQPAIAADLARTTILPSRSGPRRPSRPS